MQLSIVTTMYNSAPYVVEFYDRASRTAQKITDSYEILFVNDGSPDDSLGIALSLFRKDEKVKVVDFSRNFGHHKAIMTGLAYAKGAHVFLIDIDLEEAPELLEQYWEAFHATPDIDVVYGVQDKRRGGWFHKLSGMGFYSLFNTMSSHRLPPNQVTSRLMSKKYVDALTNFKEKVIMFGGLSILAGFNQRPLVINKLESSPTTYTLREKLSLLIRSITSFSNKPLIYIFYAGNIFFLLTLLYFLYLVFNKLFLGAYVAGWTSLIASVWLVGGVVVFCLGIIAVYLSTIFVEVKSRPFTIIRRVYDRDHGEDPT